MILGLELSERDRKTCNCALCQLHTALPPSPSNFNERKEYARVKTLEWNLVASATNNPADLKQAKDWKYALDCYDN
jgi:hypothetical protein